jgi:hypothetical protein
MAIITPTHPPKTCKDVVRAARSALRKLRDTKTTKLPSQQQQTRLIIQLPFPSPTYASSPPEQADLLRAYDEGEWPGGIQQKFHSLKSLVETLLEGYQPSFVGMLESPADGIGVWSAAGSTMTITTLVSNPTFSPFAKLCSGEYGSKILQNDHTILCINPSWTNSRDIGQLWDGELRRQAALLIDGGVASPPWMDVYNYTDVRTPSGATGLLLYSYGGQWEVWFCPDDAELYELTTNNDDDGSGDGCIVLTSDEKPELKVMWAALDGKRKEYNSSSGDRKKKKNGWW